MSVKASDLLPIGSVVRLKGAKKRVIILGVLQEVTGKDGKIKEFDYAGLPYPEGFINAQSVVMFQADEIEMLTFIGYSDEERDEFIKQATEFFDKNSEQ
jgi:hypothetical protein